jgi:hypothetical protein
MSDDEDSVNARSWAADLGPPPRSWQDGDDWPDLLPAGDGREWLPASHRDLPSELAAATATAIATLSDVAAARRLLSRPGLTPGVASDLLMLFARFRSRRRAIFDAVQPGLMDVAEASARFGETDAHTAAWMSGCDLWAAAESAVAAAVRRRHGLSDVGPATWRGYLPAVATAASCLPPLDRRAVTAAVLRESRGLWRVGRSAGEPSGPRNRGGAPRKALSPMDMDILAVWRSASPHPQPQAIVGRLKPKWPGIKVEYVRTLLNRERQRERTGTSG